MPVLVAVTLYNTWPGPATTVTAGARHTRTQFANLVPSLVFCTVVFFVFSGELEA